MCYCKHWLQASAVAEAKLKVRITKFNYIPIAGDSCDHLNKTQMRLKNFIHLQFTIVLLLHWIFCCSFYKFYEWHIKSYEPSICYRIPVLTEPYFSVGH